MVLLSYLLTYLLTGCKTLKLQLPNASSFRAVMWNKL